MGKFRQFLTELQVSAGNMIMVGYYCFMFLFTCVWCIDRRCIACTCMWWAGFNLRFENTSRVERKTGVSQMVGFPQT